MTREQGARWVRACGKVLLSCWLSLLAAGAIAQEVATDTGVMVPQADSLLERTHDFDIPAGSLDSALTAFSEQSGIQTMYEPQSVSGAAAVGIRGVHSSSEALRLLLEPSGLTWLPVNGHTVALRRGDGAALSSPISETVDVDRAAMVQRTSRGGIEEVIVTAQKRAERIQDIPISISAFTQEDLTRSQIAGGPDLITQIPNFTFTKTNFSSYSIQIRGIGTQAVSATTDPAVAVAFNNTPFIRNRFFEQEFFDLDRVEVLRGPQGTLYGRNATAGVVNLISAKPEFFAGARVSADLGNYNSHRLEHMVNLPLVEDAVALRFAGAWTRRDGYATNELTGSPIDGRDLWSARTSLRIKPNDGIDVNLIWEHFEENDDRLRSGKQLCDKDTVMQVGGVATTGLPTEVWGAGGANDGPFSGVQATLSQGCKRNSLYSKNSFQTPNGAMLPYYLPLGAIGLPAALTDPYASAVQSRDLRKIESSVDPDYRAKSDITELQISFQLTDDLTLASETAFGADTVYSMQDFNRFNTAPGAWRDRWIDDGTYGDRDGVFQDGPNGGIFCDPQLGCSDRLMAVDVASSKATQFSQELRLSSDFDGPFNFSMGANYLRSSSEDKYYIFFNSTSLIASLISGYGHYDPYVPSTSTNAECLRNGYRQGDPNDVYIVQGCIYMDPNGLGNLNDEGHNYFLSRNPYELRSYAVFGETYWNITDTLKLTAGARWSVDQKEAPRIPSWVLASHSVGYPVAEVYRQEWREPTGRLVLDWKPDLSFTDETLLYGSIGRGYKAGGANPPGFVRIFYADLRVAEAAAASSSTRPTTFKPEFVNAFEIGAKNTLFDGRLTANVAAFYYDYAGYQISEIVDRSAFNRNYDASVWGLEIETDWYALENLKLGFKGGYQMTRLDKGQEAIDLMDRTAGNPDWLVVRPFPTFASSCILPTSMFVTQDRPIPVVAGVGGVGGGNNGGCEMAYLLGLDPITALPYVENPTVQADYATTGLVASLDYHPGYAGFDPSKAPNNGEGIAKDLSGNELPNAPNYTATITADWTLPLGDAWAVTLHTDLHWQSKSWWRVFNDHEYGRLDDYYTMNLAAIFSNPRSGWNVMAYIKNVTDETAISGAFLNSDDTGLTTNIFLTEPRLFGLRVTKEWNGDSLLGSFGARRDSGERWPLSLSVGGQFQKVDAPNETVQPSFAAAFAGPLDVAAAAQDRNLEWGQSREIELGWRPYSGPWTLSVGYRNGRTSSGSAAEAEVTSEPRCVLRGGDYEFFCDMPDAPPLFALLSAYNHTDYAQAKAFDIEKYRFTDLSISRDVVVSGMSRSVLGLTIRRARFGSSTQGYLRGTPDWNVPDNFDLFVIDQLPASRTLYNADFQTARSFRGTGPILSWEASNALFGNPQAGFVELDWAVFGGALFGRQRTSSSSNEVEWGYLYNSVDLLGLSNVPQPPNTTVERQYQPGDRSRSKTVPLLGASLGLSYRVGGVNLAAGYRWERYLDVIDGGALAYRGYDRTLEGPNLRLSLDFGN